MYAWNQNYWRNDNQELLDFLDSDLGREWACGDLSVNIADYSNPGAVADLQKITSFIQQYRLRVRNWEAVVWLTYGDVTQKDGAAMIQFTKTFFDWLDGIPADVALSMGKVGISYDVEHLDPEFTKQALMLAQSRKQGTNFPEGAILVQHTIEGDNNVLGTEYVMKYADSALAMVYRNYMHDPTGRYQDDSNILNRLMWMLTEQCPRCLDDAYATQNFKAKITIMVEASCKMGNGCGKLSFCAFSGSDQGAHTMADVFSQMEQEMISGNRLTQAQHDRLFSKTTPYATHDWEWFRCYAPFSSAFSYSSCDHYQTYASSCRAS